MEMPEKQSDLSQVIREFISGDSAALEPLVRVCGPIVFRAVRRQLGRRSPRFDSADIAQAVWASFFADPIDRTVFKTPNELLGHLVAISINKVRRAQRDNFSVQKRDANREVSWGSASVDGEVASLGSPSPSQFAMADETWERLLAETPEDQQKILYLKREGNTQDQIAASLGVSSKTVARLLRRLKERISK